MDERKDTIPEATSQEMYELLKIRALESIKADLLAWAKRRFWIVALVLAGVGYFGGSNLIEIALQKRVQHELDRMRDVTQQTELAGRLAEERAEAATTTAREADEQAKAYTKTVSELQQEINSLKKSAQVITERYFELDGEAGNIRGIIVKDINGLRVRLESIEGFVAKLAKETAGASPDVLVTFEAEIKKVRRAAENLEKQFKENSQYRVNIYFTERTKDLSANVFEKLMEVGYKTSTLAMAQARQLLRAVQSDVPLIHMRAASDLSTLKVDVITYTTDVQKKAEEVRELLAPLLEIGRLETLPRRAFVERFGDPFLAQVSPGRFFASNLIEVYLVRGE
ncbi:MAG: hypothetical protein FVQ84_05230 [Planctomycetes bacterium]|nr:hypothetical protein [Planctomycetota bacterium]